MPDKSKPNVEEHSGTTWDKTQAHTPTAAPNVAAQQKHVEKFEEHGVQPSVAEVQQAERWERAGIMEDHPSEYANMQRRQSAETLTQPANVTDDDHRDMLRSKTPRTPAEDAELNYSIDPGTLEGVLHYVAEWVRNEIDMAMLGYDVDYRRRNNPMSGIIHGTLPEVDTRSDRVQPVHDRAGRGSRESAPREMGTSKERGSEKGRTS